jgi:alanine racemase
MSHLSCSEERKNEHNKHQLDRFLEVIKSFPKARYSIANSSGIFLGPEYHFDLVRSGMALYGLNPTPYLKQNPMQLAFKLESKIIQIRDINDFCYVGYGCTYKANPLNKIATVAIGYYDGYPISLSNNSVVYINGQQAPVIGRVSMDLITVDVTEIKCSSGDTVEVIGPNVTPEYIASRSGQISYSVCTGLSSSINRIYSNIR